MCPPTFAAKEKPEQALAVLIRSETGIAVDPNLLRLFLRAHWPAITTLAHAIHGGSK